MQKYILDHYLKMNALTYYNFDIYFMDALNHLIDDKYASRDIQMLYFIHNSDTPITPSHLKNQFRLQPSAVSNRLSFFESEDLIIRKSDTSDSRNTVITLTEKGKSLEKTYQDYMKGFSTKVRKSLSFGETIDIIPTLRKLQQLVDLSKNSTQSKEELSPNLLNDLMNYFTSIEIEFIEKQAIPLKQRDVFILSEWYIYTLMDPKYALTDLSNHLRIPYQTLVSKMKKYVKQSLVTKLDHQYIIQDDLIRDLREFIYLRLVIYNESMAMFNDKEKKLIYKLFEQLKLYALDTVNNKKTA